MPRPHVYEIIDGERKYQAAKHPTHEESKPLTVGEELLLIQRYTTKAIEAWADNHGDYNAMDNIRKIAGIAVRAMEHHPTPERAS